MTDVLWTMLAGFFKSRARERDEFIAALDAADRPVFARPIRRDHAPWPGAGAPGSYQERPFQPWPGSRS